MFLLQMLLLEKHVSRDGLMTAFVPLDSWDDDTQVHDQEEDFVDVDDSDVKDQDDDPQQK